MENKRGMIDFTKHMNISHKKETVWHEKSLGILFRECQEKESFSKFLKNLKKFTFSFTNLIQ